MAQMFCRVSTRTARLYAALTTFLLLAACNRDVCLGLNKPSADRNAPKLLNIEMVQQDEQNPWMVVMGLTFADRDGDLSEGDVLLYVGASTPEALPLTSYFEVSELSPTATSGRLMLPLSLSQGLVQDDTTVRFGFQLKDALSHYSNCYTLDLHFDITNIPFTRVHTQNLNRVACRRLAPDARGQKT